MVPPKASFSLNYVVYPHTTFYLTSVQSNECEQMSMNEKNILIQQTKIFKGKKCCFTFSINSHRHDSLWVSAVEFRRDFLLLDGIGNPY